MPQETRYEEINGKLWEVESPPPVNDYGPDKPKLEEIDTTPLEGYFYGEIQ